MNQDISFIMERFVYTKNIPVIQLFDIWKEKLKIKAEYINNNSSVLIIHNNKKDICAYLSNIEKHTIPTDCRFFAMFISNLNSSNTTNSFLMHLNKKCIEILVPDNCFYISLDTKKIYHEKIDIISATLGCDQGQWIYKYNEKYIGIGEDGIIELDIKSWIERYKKCVTKYVDFDLKPIINDNVNIKYLYLCILKTLIKQHGLCISIYKFENLDIIDILK